MTNVMSVGDEIEGIQEDGKYFGTEAVSRSRIDETACDILTRVLAAIEVFYEVPDDALQRSIDPYFTGMQNLGVPYRPGEWFDPLSETDRRACSRATRRLERNGLMHRITESGRDRVTHLVPTPDGIRLALELVGDQADVGSILLSLKRTKWGDELQTAIWEMIGNRDGKGFHSGKIDEAAPSTTTT